MIQTTKGIVLHTLQYSETSVIAKIYTESFGLVSYILKGVRSSRSQNKAALLHPPNILEMVVYQRDQKNLQTIKEFKSGFIFQSIPYDTIKTTVCMLLLEVLSKCIKEQEANPDKYDFIENSLIFIDQVEVLDPKFHMSFLLKLTGFLGFAPRNNYEEDYQVFDLQQGEFLSKQPEHQWAIIEPESGWFDQLLNCSYLDLPGFTIPKKERQLILKHIILYYRFHVEGFGELKSPKILAEILQ